MVWYQMQGVFGTRRYGLGGHLYPHLGVGQGRGYRVVSPTALQPEPTGNADGGLGLARATLFLPRWGFVFRIWGPAFGSVFLASVLSAIGRQSCARSSAGNRFAFSPVNVRGVIRHRVGKALIVNLLAACV
jgi:hypothetical protein